MKGKTERNKLCIKCGEDSWQPNGKYWRCSPCLVRQRAERYSKNKEKILKYNKEWAENNRELSNNIKKNWKLRNPEKDKSLREAWRLKNKNLVNSYTSLRRKRVKQATPKWISSLDKFIIREMYLQSLDLKDATGIDFHIDHIIPLRGVNVCGLHLPDNLRIISAKDNLEKSNGF